MKRIFLVLVLAVFSLTAISQKSESLLIGDDAPSFKANTTNGKLNFPSDFGDSWKILFSHPRDFTPVCTSEILQLAHMQKQFDDLGVKIAIISTDNVSQHAMWKKSIEEINVPGKESVKIMFPLIDDEDVKISRLYSMIHDKTSTTKDVRGVYIISPDNVIQTINFYPMQVGRNIDEIVRTVEALQAVAENDVLTPANWTPGGDVLLPYSPYPSKELDENPELKKQYYNVGTHMWYKKQ